MPAGRLCKTATREGPIGDAFTAKFTVVYGAANRAQQEEAQAFCRNWNHWMGGHIAAHPDTAVTAADIAAGNLILFGTVESSALLRRISPQLPIQVSDSGITLGQLHYTGTNFGAYFIYPNPLNPAHYLVVSHQHIPGAGVKDLEALPWYWPDYVIFDTDRKPGRCIQHKLAYLPDTFVNAGYFDSGWQLNIGTARPDLLIRTEAQQEFTGDGREQPFAGKTVTQRCARHATAVYYVDVCNYGDLDDNVLLTAGRSGNGMTVHYFDVPTGEEVSAQLTGASGWGIPLDKGAVRQLRVEVTWKQTVPAGAACDTTLTVVSQADSSKSAQVTAVTQCAETTSAP